MTSVSAHSRGKAAPVPIPPPPAKTHKKRPPLAKAVFLCGKEIVSAFRELEPLAGTGLAGLFAFLHARIACQQAFLLERDAERLVDLDERTADRQAQGAGLAIDAAADCSHCEIVGMDRVGDFQRTENLVLDGEAGEVISEIAAVHFDGSRAGLKTNAGHGGLAASCGLDGFCCAHTKKIRRLAGSVRCAGARRPRRL